VCFSDIDLLCRKYQRPYYKKHRSTRRAGWNHLECQLCNSYKRDIRKESDGDKRREIEAEYKDHIDRAMFARKAYYTTRKKAVDNKHHGDVSMIVDAAGGSGTIFLPRYSTTEKNEPARHEMCKIKSTIIKVHGVGTKVVITIPELEMQGANLTFECVLQGLIMFLDESGIKKLRNLYVQLDNVSSNKSYTLAAAFAALIYLGICKKVKVSYLEVIRFFT
jgi:hypothetical protein